MTSFLSNPKLETSVLAASSCYIFRKYFVAKTRRLREQGCGWCSSQVARRQFMLPRRLRTVVIKVYNVSISLCIRWPHVSSCCLETVWVAYCEGIVYNIARHMKYSIELLSCSSPVIYLCLFSLLNVSMWKFKSEIYIFTAISYCGGFVHGVNY